MVIIDACNTEPTGFSFKDFWDDYNYYLKNSSNPSPHSKFFDPHA